MMDSSRKHFPRHRESRMTENVLVLQGGGSLGAFSCGVFKTLSSNGITFDTIGGTSIGAVNAAIICGSKNDDPAKDMEDFWTEIGENSYQIIPDIFIPRYDYSKHKIEMDWTHSSVLNAIMFGVPGFFVPRWNQMWLQNMLDGIMAPADWTHYYDHASLARTLEKYVDYSKLARQKESSAGNGKSPRLVITAVDVITARALIFDSAKMDIQPKHILASSAYSAYGFPWIEVDTNVYAWDGSLLSNTPLKEIIEASPRNDKNVYIVENYPRKIDRLPRNRSEVMDRTKDITFSDKTIYDLRAWKHISRQTELIEKLYELFETNIDKKSLDPLDVAEIRKEYDALVGQYGAEILAINRISRNRMESPHVLKNADFSLGTIRDLIRQGEEKTVEHLKGKDEGDLAELIRLL